jgi:HSP20 family protein
MTLVKFNNNGTRKAVTGPRFIDVFDPFFNDRFFNQPQINKIPAVNIAEHENGFDIELAVPGLKKEDIKINVDKDVLTVSSEAKKEEVTEGKNYSKKEFSYNSFSRSFNLPDSVDQNSIEASYIDGVLKLTIAKKEEAKLQPREIAVK